MNCTQNEKLNQVTPHTLIVGVDIAKFKHVLGHKMIEERWRWPR
ncbi:hypothetical protein PMEGAPL128_63470 [Priestia megaterium]